MRNVLKFMMVGALIASAASAQDESGSVNSILKELSNVTGKPTTATPVVVKKPVVKAPAVVAEKTVIVPVVVPVEITVAEPTVAKKSKGWKFWSKGDKKEVVAVKETSPAATGGDKAAPAQVVASVPAKDGVPPAAIAALDVPATLEASRELYAGGEFAQAQRGFDAVVKKDPENVVARMYLRKILERDPRTAEVKGMKAVTAGWKTDLVLRSYAISSDSATKMGLEKSTESADVTLKFPEVNFPKGASAVYQPKTEKLFVRNTRENLTVLEETLAAMDVAKLSSGVEQVEIEAKFIEVSEGTLEQLGFEWRSVPGAAIGRPAKNINTGLEEGGKVTIPEGSYLFDDALRGGPGNAAGMPFAKTSTMGDGEISAGAGEWKAFRFDDTFNSLPANMTLEHRGNNPLDILISALDQSSGTDVLSAPRIVTQSGKKATIRVGEMHYFPEVYEVGGGEGDIVHVKYADFAEKLLGVELDVNPKVDGDQISLSLNPKVSELLGWQNYQIAPANSAYSYYQLGINQQFNHDPIVARLPIFKRREIKTEVTIADGATMGMGGLINEKVEKYEDKVPVLGSLPLIGRLFRNEGERAVKRNLMIFVTAKKVEPTGRINSARSFE